MDYLEFLLGTPYSYTAFGGVLLGIGVGGLIPGGGFRYSDSARRASRLTRFYFMLSFALAVAAGGILISGASAFGDVGVAYMAAVALGLAAVVSRFPRSAGSVAAIAAAVCAVLVWALNAAWHSPLAESPEARFRTLRAGGGTMVVEHLPTIDADEDRGRIFTLTGGEFSVEADVIRISDYLFFVGAGELFRLRSVHSRAQDGAAADAAGSEPFPRSQLVLANWVTDLLRRREARIPGIRLSTLRSAYVAPRPLEQYSLELAPPSIELVWDKSLREARLQDDTISRDDDYALSGR